MSTQIKNTLFRFVTMRAPEFLEKEAVNQKFVFHPESEKAIEDTFDSVFLQAANHVPSNISKKKSLQNAATTFASSALKKREELYENGLIQKELYDFAMWLTKNRTKITAELINEKTASFSQVLSNNQLASNSVSLGKNYSNQLWDNLFYQIITYKSGYIREAILSVLVAEFFLKNYQNIDQTDDAFRKLAQSRVVIPSTLFEKEDTSAIKSQMQQAINSLPINTKELDKQADLLHIQEQIEAHKAIVQELKKAQSVYNKANQKAYETARKAHETTVTSLYANAETTETTVLDPATNQQKTVTEYVNLQIPAFEFESEPQLQSNAFASQVSQKTASVVNQMVALNEFETFDEVITKIEQTIENATQYVFQNTTVSETLINANGIAIPVINATSSSSVFKISAFSSEGNSMLTFLFSDSVEQADIVAANYTLTFDDGSVFTETDFTDTIENNRLIVKTFLSGLSYFDKSSFTITGTFTKSNGTLIDFSGEGTVQELNLGMQKLIPIDGILSYRLSGSGRYALKSILDTGDGGSGTGTGTGGNTGSSSTDGSVLEYIPSGYGIKRLGILDYRRVEQEVCCYVPGEVSHIENIMAREYKEKSTRRLRHSENTVTKSNESEVEKLTDTTSTDRFEMNQEIASMLAKDTHFGANASAGYSQGSQEGTGVVTINAGADFATNTTSEESNSQAVTHAKEVTQRALDRVVQKVKEERISKIVEEFEEINKHGFDNTKGEKHVSGTYRWIDKVYRNQVVNYGKRLMYEFMIPEPAAFQKIASAIKKEIGVETLEKPIDPRKADSKIVLALDDYFESNYKFWASKYNVSLKETPIKQLSLSKSLGYSTVSGAGVESKSDVIKIPKGYVSKKGDIVVSYNAEAYGTGDFDVIFGDKGFRKHNFPRINKIENIVLEGFTDEIAIGFGERNNYTINFSFTIKCDITPESYEKWKVETFNAIITAYEDKLAIYNAKMADLKSLQENNVKVNPGFFRQIENMVLRKNCIEYLNSHELTGTGGLTTGSAMQDFQVNYEALSLETVAARTKFFEQAFEWNLMSYYFYPFYWADKNKWADLYNDVNVDDPTFRAFLQSGMARVIVTVRPGFEEAVNWYMKTGQIWNGGQVPAVNDPLFLSIVDELRETEGAVEETWETKVPTSLTIIQAGSIGLNVQGLPCDEDCADYKLFDSDGQPVLDGNGKPISTNPIVQTNAVLGNTEIVIPPYGGGNLGNPTEGTNPDPYVGQNATM